MREIVLLIAALGSPALAFAQDHEGGTDGVMEPAAFLGVTAEEGPLTPEIKAESNRIGDELVCLCGTCPRFTIANCDCGWAHASMQIIRNALAKKKTGAEIMAAYERAYGTKVYPKPPGALGELTWLIPYAAAILLLGFLFAFGVRAIRRQKGSSLATAGASATDTGAEDRERLRRELEDLD